MQEDRILTKDVRVSDDSSEATFHVCADSPLFHGHFPSNPVLPAIALIELVERTIRLGMPDANASITQLTRVRFRQMVRPGDDISVIVTPDDRTRTGRYRYRIQRQADLVSEGVVVMGKAADGETAEPRTET